MNIELEEMEHGKVIKYSSIADDKQTKIKAMKAKKQYVQILEYTDTLPSSKDRYLLKSYALMHLKKWKEVCDCCDLGLEVEEDSEFYNMKGRAMGKMGNMGQKRDLTKKAIQMDGSVPAYYRNLGAALYKLKQYEAAIVQHKKAISKQPTNSINYHNVGAAYFRMDKYEEAKDFFKKSVQYNKKQALSHSWLGDCYSKTGDLKTAVGCYTRAYEVSGNETYKKERDRLENQLNPKKGFFSKLFS